MDRILAWRGRWIGRKSCTVAGSRGLAPLEARRILTERAVELRGPMLRGYWRGVREIRPEWAIADPSDPNS